MNEITGFSHFTHVEPLDDLITHVAHGLDCPCGPVVNWEDELIVHHAMDGRKDFE